MSRVITRHRDKDHRDSTSRSRFRERLKGHIKKAIDKSLSDANVTDIGKGGVDVSVPRKGLKQHSIHHAPGGDRRYVVPGNKEYSVGDYIEKPQGGSGGGGPKGSPDGEGEDDFIFHLTEDEFLSYLFEDLELPNMDKASDADNPDWRPKRAGHVSSGPFNKLDLARSRMKRIGRTLATDKKIKDQILLSLAEEFTILSQYAPQELQAPDLQSAWQSTRTKIDILTQRLSLLKGFDDAVSTNEALRLQELRQQREELKRRLCLTPPWNESTDLRFRNHIMHPFPQSRAVMFCLMDVSGSMDEERKSLAKIFYFLLYRFLKRNYDRTDIVFVRYHSTAKEVDEKEFFYGIDTGGTVVSNGLEVVKNIATSRYSSSGWNRYLANVSDGDNTIFDNARCRDLLEELVQQMQATFYMEIPHRDTQELWDIYQDLQGDFPGKVFSGVIEERKDIWPLFRDFFKRHTTTNTPRSAASYLSLNKV